MSRSRKQAQRPRTWPLWSVVSLIVLLSAAALALSYVALIGVGSGEHPGLPTRTETAASEEAPVAPPLIDAPSEPPAVPPAAPNQQRLLAMVNGTAMRANAGTCETPGTVEFSLNAGQSWTESASLAGAGATQILRVLPTDPSLIQVVALDGNCNPQVYRSADLGTTWDGPLPVAGTWYFDPSNPAQVGTPDGMQPLTCDGAELAAAGDRAAVRCEDGSVLTTTDRGVTWTEETGLTNVLAINYSPDSYVVAQTDDAACEGLRLATLGENSSSVLDGCFEADLAAEELNADNIAIAQSGTYTLLWAGDDLVTSTDGGRTWL